MLYNPGKEGIFKTKILKQARLLNSDSKLTVDYFSNDE